MKQLGYLVAIRIRALFGVGAILLASSGCGTQITSLRQAVSGISNSSYANPPDVTSLTITNTSPTAGNPLTLNWGLAIGAHTHYCVLENASDPNTCIWRTGALPTTYADSASDGLLELTVFLKNPAGISSPVVSNTVLIDRTAPELASVAVTNPNPTNTATFGLTYGAVSNAPYSQYCILENNITIGNCVWQTGVLPATYVVTAVDGAKNLSVWIRDDAGNSSARVFTGAVTLDLTVPTVAISNPAAGTFITPANMASFTVNGTWLGRR